MLVDKADGKEDFCMRGYFGIGVEGITKPANAGALFRTAHAFGASFFFTIATDYTRREGNQADTADSSQAVPWYDFPDLDAMQLPRGCTLVGIELTDDAVALPAFRHPIGAAYVLGRERGALTPEMLARCAHVVQIPTRFCINVATAGAIVMYDRAISMGRFAERPLMAGGATAGPPEHVHGGPVFRTPERIARFRKL